MYHFFSHLYACKNIYGVGYVGRYCGAISVLRYKNDEGSCQFDELCAGVRISYPHKGPFLFPPTFSSIFEEFSAE